MSRNEVAPGTEIREGLSLPSAPVVAAASAKHKDQYDDQDNQRGRAHELSFLPCSSSRLVLGTPAEKRTYYPGVNPGAR